MNASGEKEEEGRAPPSPARSRRPRATLGDAPATLLSPGSPRAVGSREPGAPGACPRSAGLSLGLGNAPQFPRLLRWPDDEPVSENGTCGLRQRAQ